MRNVAVVAHVDHGKTSLLASFLRFVENTESSRSERSLDSNDLERERGITILAKCTAVVYNDCLFNMVDTPGHADFGGEVERILNMVDGILLVVDAYEGPMGQTKFVLSKALQAGLPAVVVLNKVDNPNNRVGEVENEIFDLFAALEASDQQLEYPVVYASAKEGWSMEAPYEKGKGKDMQPLLDAIVSHLPGPQLAQLDTKSQLFSMVVSMLQSDRHFGRMYTGRIHSGTIRMGGPLNAIKQNGAPIGKPGKVMRLFRQRGLDNFPVDEASAGDIVTLAGIDGVTVSDTLCEDKGMEPLPAVPIAPPTVAITVGVNTAPTLGKDGGKYLNSGKIAERLYRESETNVSIVVKPGVSESFEVYGRGDLQLGVLLETMRREGYEMTVSPPRVIFGKDEDGNVTEPIEEVTIDVDEEFTSSLMEKMIGRKAELLEVKEVAGKTRLRFLCPDRGLIGFQSEFHSETRGTGVMSHAFHSYQPYKGDLGKQRKGALVSMAEGKCTAFALHYLEPRGILFVAPNTVVYPGMIVGMSMREKDVDVNPCKAKEFTNVRSVQAEEKLTLSPHRRFTLEAAIAWLQDDEVLEITPQNIRMRKQYLDANERKKNAKKKP